METEFWFMGWYCTLPETNIAPESGGFQQEFPFPRVYANGQDPCHVHHLQLDVWKHWKKGVK